jgi:cell division protease FtsH
MRISYAKFLQLLRGNRIKRLIIYGDLRTAIVEVSTALQNDTA